MGARVREIDEIVDSNTFFHHLMMATSAHFACDRWMLSICCTCPAETETKCKTKAALAWARITSSLLFWGKRVHTFIKNWRYTLYGSIYRSSTDPYII